MLRYLILGVAALMAPLFWPFPPSWQLLAIIFIAALLAMLRRLWGLALVALCLLWSLSYACYYASALRHAHHLASSTGANISIKAQTLAVAVNPSWLKITVKLQQLEGFVLLPSWPLKAQLYLPKSVRSAVAVGDLLHAKVKLKPAYGSVNPHSFDYSRWLVSQGLALRGSVKQLELSAQPASWRDSLRGQLKQQLKLLDFSGELQALAFGDKGAIERKRSERYRQLGLSHLYVVSGLHLSIVAAWGLVLGSVLSLLFRRGGRVLPRICALIFATWFCWLSGADIPVLRAWVMLLVVLLCWSSYAKFSASQSLLFAALVVLLLWPNAAYSNSFYLSFSAVAAIMLGLWLIRAVWWWRLLAIQLAIGLFMLPLQMLLFEQLAWHSLLVNLLQVSLFSLLVVPAVFVASLCTWLFPSFAQLLWHWLDSLLQVNQNLLFSLPIEQGPWVAANSGILLLLLTVSALLLLCLARRRQLHLYALLLLLGSVLSGSGREQVPWKLHFFDVGQGSAVALLKGSHAVLYDTGPRFGSGFSFARSAIIPYLKAEGIEQLDYLIISHGDNDHAGGLAEMRLAYPAAKTVYGNDRRLPEHNCRGELQWQGLNIRLLSSAQARGNNGSCVVLIKDDDFTMLLAGDIEAETEQELLAEFELAADVLLSPHHGSRSSSSSAFVEAVSPRWVIHSAGAYNRYNFPSDVVQERYQSAEQLITYQEGGIELVVVKDGVQISKARDLWPKRWFLRIISW